MAYCVLSDIQGHFPNMTLDSESDPTDSQVTGWIDEVSDNVIDPQIGALVNLPVTDTKGLALLKQITIWAVIAEVYRSLDMQERASQYQSQADNVMKRVLTSPTMIQPASTGYSTTSHTGRSPVFRRGEDQW